MCICFVSCFVLKQNDWFRIPVAWFLLVRRLKPNMGQNHIEYSMVRVQFLCIGNLINNRSSKENQRYSDRCLLLRCSIKLLMHKRACVPCYFLSDFDSFLVWGFKPKMIMQQRLQLNHFAWKPSRKWNESTYVLEFAASTENQQDPFFISPANCHFKISGLIFDRSVMQTAIKWPKVIAL